MRCLVSNLKCIEQQGEYLLSLNEVDREIFIYWSEDIFIDPDSRFNDRLKEILNSFTGQIYNALSAIQLEGHINDLLIITKNQGSLFTDIDRAKVFLKDKQMIHLGKCDCFDEIERATFNAYSQVLN